MSQSTARRSPRRSLSPRSLTSWVIITLGALNAWGCYEPSAIKPTETCHPSAPECAQLDFDGDGAPNGVDDFPLDPRCAQESARHCGACERSCQSGFACLEQTCIPVDSERCDGLDNDRDEVIDEGITPPDATLNIGVCEGLTRRCAAQEGWVDPDLSAISGYEPDELSCDGLDNDCDGLVDERLAPPLATPQRGVCIGSEMSCEGELGWIPPNRLLTISQYEASELSCDGLDNDCDGRVDERVDGEACSTNAQGACRAGRTRCAQGELSCEALYTPTAERCDYTDNDCDGEIDEELTPPESEETLGVCRSPLGRCELGQWVISSIEVIPSYEVIERTCDGLDNDCDGAVDEGMVTESCTIEGALGPCARGELICREGAMICIPTHDVTLEVCNGVDDDCDGGLDEALELELYPEQRGVCAGLRTVCEAGELRGADPQRISSYEDVESTCDGLDNDCDGVTDEDTPRIPCESGLVGNCALGELRCAEGRSTCLAPQPSDERCDGLDNDCDGGVDESLVAPRSTLTAGVCADRYQRCDGALGWIDPPEPPSYEEYEVSCDGLDNDCDGLTDEGSVDEGNRYPLDDDPLLLGVCRAQRLICESGSLRAPNQAERSAQISSYQETESTCDGLDNDCDGSIDEGIEPRPCVSELSGVCQTGERACVEGVTRCLPQTEPTPELCDGLDNDCDGAIDEALTLGECVVGVGACAARGQTRCEAGVFQCDVTPNDPRDERCNGLDDDCDGVIDERFALSELGCEVGEGICARQGQWSCSLGALVCNAVAGPAFVERCDGLDNDCDGSVDEDYVTLNRPCVAGIGACEVRGLWRCSTLGELQCADGPDAPEPERCDSLDNDCDGLIDEHITSEVCDAIDNDCDGSVDEVEDGEICDARDNDCDGVIDESPCAPCLESDSGCPNLNWSTLPSGDFLIGGERADERPLTAVRISSFQLSDEITVDHYQACVRAGVCSAAGTGGDCNAGQVDRADYPINCVSWLQAYHYASWVGARLPSEAEWEYAARSAGRGAPTPWGGGEVTCDSALLRDSAGYGCGLNESARIRAPRNASGVSAQGVWDLLGNVAEWVEDDYVDQYSSSIQLGLAYCDPIGCSAQGDKVYRGGGWRTDVSVVDNRARASGFYLLRSAEIGFRVARYGP